MPTITALEPQRRKGRLNVFVDGQFVIGVGEAVAADLNLRVGREITADKLREVAGAEEVHKATEAALGLLEVRARATREIETRLKQKGYEEGVIAQVDRKTAAAGTAGRRPVRRAVGRGPLPPRRQPAHRAAAPADRAVREGRRQGRRSPRPSSASPTRTSWPWRGRRRPKKVRHVPADPDALRAERQKLMGFLQRRGFGWEIVKAVTREALPAPSDAEDEAGGT